MLKVKRLYTFVIQTFLPVFAMTFAICLFIVLMQFLWRYVEDLVGKGLDISVLAELFLYAAFQLIPMALPLSLLLASLMAFGNLGERLELLAIKASGVSLLKAMRPLIILVAFVCIGAFFFQNEAMPRIQVKLRALLYSIKQKSPELDIPEGSFYSDIPNYSLYVKRKDRDTKMLHDVIIYDTSKGFDNMAVITCDSATMEVSEDKSFLLLSLMKGQQFANFRQADINNTSPGRRNNEFVPYSRENFNRKEVIIPFNTGFDRMDESNLDGTQISKNITQLGHSIDSMSVRLDSVNTQDRKIIGKHTYLTYRNSDTYQKKDSIKHNADIVTKEEIGRINFDSLVHSFSKDEMIQYLGTAASEAENSRFNILETTQKIALQKNLRFHKVEWHQKFVLSFACLIFFFIGAPLGAIIRKGGLGMPVVVSVALFIVYYIINNIGYKMARDGVWESWQGMWLSSFALFPLGVFLTYKAMNDSALFNTEAYGNFFRRLLGLNKKKIYETNESVDESLIPALSTLNANPEVVATLKMRNVETLKDVVKNHEEYGYGTDTIQVVLSILKEKGASFFDVKIRNLDFEEAKNIYKTFLNSFKLATLFYVVGMLYLVIQKILQLDAELFGTIALLGYIVFYIRTFICYFDFYRCIDKKPKKNIGIAVFLSFVCIWAFYRYFKKQMDKDLDNIKE
ncbi:LptF/LptG family permease [Dysgonomonas sp. Marseille-P4677]|uniref:LptF/LptG family permease n=1 Tax=Dysgonomonas sp. Marseille-P4677 TaxID=2364790 RepID=UPI001913540B|nr:LptF/LptG family permease [Dysgonomonas sp. Marseille-P4677]MBK5720545.1 LptF/LptG family permease [Dysgonomonas sp. Marseille-P4677]